MPYIAAARKFVRGQRVTLYARLEGIRPNMKTRRLPVVLIAFAVASWLGAVLEVRAAMATEVIDADAIEFETSQSATSQVSVISAGVSVAE